MLLLRLSDWAQLKSCGNFQFGSSVNHIVLVVSHRGDPSFALLILL